MKQISELEYKGMITAEQGYKLRQLSMDGYDVTEALKGRISGVRRCNEMSRFIKAGNNEGIRNLIIETKNEENAEAAMIEAFLKKQ